MQWTDEGIIISTRRHGETSLIVELMTRVRGRHLGLVRGGRSRKVQPILQATNTVSATWRARLDEHLGNYAVEPVDQRAARLIDSAAGLYGLQAVASLVGLLPERDPHPHLYAGLAAVLDWLHEPLAGGALLVRFELRLLEELGFGLDLERCAATGETGDLAFVSPKSGRAVGRVAGEPYRERLFALPRFLAGTGDNARPDMADIVTGFALTGHFLARHVFEPRGLAMPEGRIRYLALLQRTATATTEAAE